MSGDLGSSSPTANVDRIGKWSVHSVLPMEGLQDEVAHHTAIIGMHTSFSRMDVQGRPN